MGRVTVMRPPAVSAVARCAEPLSDGRRYVTVHLLTGQRLYFSVDVSTNAGRGDMTLSTMSLST